MPSPSACASTPQAWHIAMPSGESGIHPISTSYVIDIRIFMHGSTGQSALSRPVTDLAELVSRAYAMLLTPQTRIGPEFPPRPDGHARPVGPNRNDLPR